MQSLDNKNKLLEYMAQGGAIITPNNRLSAKLLQDYFKEQGHQTQDKPFCMPYTKALQRAFDTLQFKTPYQQHPLVFNKTQCEYLWLMTLKACPDLIFNEGLLKALIDAFNHCQLWQIPVNDPSFNHSAQTLQFQRFWKTVRRQLKTLNAITEHELVPYLIKNGLLFPKTIIWVCFDEFTPQQLSLQTALADLGHEQFQYDLKAQDKLPVLFKAADTKEEYQQIMAWLRLRLLEKDESIGVVVPNLQEKAHLLQRILLKTFEPSCFNLYLGETLADFPMIAHALVWLKLDIKQLKSQEAALVLQSPYLLEAQSEFVARAAFLEESPLLQQQHISWATFCKCLESSVPKLSKLLHSLKAFPDEASLHEWMSLFQERLNSMGFPGDIALDSLHHQCFSRFTSLFDEFRQLALITPRLSRMEALSAFNNLVNKTIFQAKKPKASIQIFGLLEASGYEFDSLWVMGLSAETLPNKTQRSPFISPHLQVKSQMPHSTPARELLFAKQTIERFQKASANTVFSYPRIEAEESHLPSALIADFPPYSPLPINEPPSLSACIAVEELYQLPLGSHEAYSGGTALLANQAKCPFKAFAAHRLHAKAALTCVDGLSQQKRGQIIHQVLEKLWRELRSQEALLRLTEAALNELIDEAIQSSLTTADFQDELLQAIETMRLKNIVQDSLLWEKKRPPFKIIALEQAYSLFLAGLNFKIRVDRLDEVGTKQWVIDYKSSLPSSKPWQEERPKEPQLLLYALLDEQINTLLFLQLKSGQFDISGFCEEASRDKGMQVLKEDEQWADYRRHWQERLSLLALEFKSGHCPPEPRPFSHCQQCDFQNLCRFQQVP